MPVAATVSGEIQSCKTIRQKSSVPKETLGADVLFSPFSA